MISSEIKEKLYTRQKLNAERKKKIDVVVKIIFLILAIICSSVVVFITIFLLVKGLLPFFQDENGNFQSLSAYFTKSRWTYDGNGGAMYLVLTTIYSTLLSLVISIPTSVFTALFIVKIVPKKLKEILKTFIEILSSIPSVIFGLFGMGVITPIIYKFSNSLNISSYGGKSLLSAIIVLAIMSIPTMTLVSITSLESVDINLDKASLALGASRQQTNYKIVLKAATSGIFAGIILGVGRALGEATAIQMVIGNNSSGLKWWNIFEIGNTLTSAMLNGIGEASGFGYNIRFSLGLTLMIIIIFTNLILNFARNKIVNKGEKKKTFSFLGKGK